jgi:hypothetical protein
MNELIPTMLVFFFAYIMLGVTFSVIVAAGCPRIVWRRFWLTVIAWPFIASWFLFLEYQRRRFRL